MALRDFRLRVNGRPLLAAWMWPAIGDAARFAELVMPPIFIEDPVIETDGTPQVGEVLTLFAGTVTDGAIAGADIELLRGATVIATNPGSTYTPVTADAGSNLSLRVTARGAGGATTVTSAAVGPIVLAEWNFAQSALAANTRPAWSPVRTINTAGNSLSVNTGAAISTGAAITAQIAPGASFGVGVNYQVGPGTNMAEALAHLNANWTTGDKTEDLLLIDPVAGETLTIGTKRFDFWRTDAVFNELETIRAQQSGGANTLLMLFASPHDSWSGVAGNATPDYIRWKERAQAKSYSADIVDARQHAIDWYGLETGFEAVQRQWNELPLGLCGNAAAVTRARTSADITIESPLTLNHDEGDPLTPAAASNNYALWRHVGPNGGGSNEEADQIHPSAAGKAVKAALVRDWDLGRQGFAPFIPAGCRFRTTANVASGATIGVIRTRGIADSVVIEYGDPDGAFVATAGGPDANGYGTITITRAAGTPITAGHKRLYVTAIKGSWRRTEVVRVMVMAASGARVPTPMTWNTPIWIKGPRASVQVTASKRFSYLFRGTLGDLASTRMLINFLKGVSNDTLFVRIGTDGRVTVNARDAANQLVLQSVSRSIGFGGPVVQAGTQFTLMGAFDWENGLRNARFNGADLPLTGTGTTFNSINSGVNFSDCSPIFLANQQPNGFWGGEGAASSGSITAAAFWPETYIDWAANESSVIDGSGNFVLSDPAYTIGGVASHPVRVRGPVADLFGGGQDASMTVLPLWRPANILDAA